MNSIWIGKHAVDQFAARVLGMDSTTLAGPERDAIYRTLRALYHRSAPLNDRDRKQYPAKQKPGNEFRKCVYTQKDKEVFIVLVIAPDNTHSSGAMKLVTVVKVGERTRS